MSTILVALTVTFPLFGLNIFALASVQSAIAPAPAVAVAAPGGTLRTPGTPLDVPSLAAAAAAAVAV